MLLLFLSGHKKASQEVDVVLCGSNMHNAHRSSGPCLGYSSVLKRAQKCLVHDAPEFCSTCSRVNKQTKEPQLQLPLFLILAYRQMGTHALTTSWRTAECMQAHSHPFPLMHRLWTCLPGSIEYIHIRRANVLM